MLLVHCAITRTVTVCVSLISTLQLVFCSRIFGGRKKLIFKWSVCGIVPVPTGMVGVILKVYSLSEHSSTVNTEGETCNKKWMVYKVCTLHVIIESACCFCVNYKNHLKLTIRHQWISSLRASSHISLPRHPNFASAFHDDPLNGELARRLVLWLVDIIISDSVETTREQAN